MASIQIFKLNPSYITELKSREISRIKGGFNLFDGFDLEAIKAVIIDEAFLNSDQVKLEDDQYLAMENFVFPEQDWQEPLANHLNNRLF